MPLLSMDDLETLVACAEGRYTGFRPQYATPCVQRNLSLLQLSAADATAIRPLEYTGWVMAEVWSYNPENVKQLFHQLETETFRFVSAALPQPRRHSLMLLVKAHFVEVETGEVDEGRCIASHTEYVEAHRQLRAYLQQLLPSCVHVRPQLGNEQDFLNLMLDTPCFLRQEADWFAVRTATVHTETPQEI